MAIMKIRRADDTWEDIVPGGLTSEQEALFTPAEPGDILMTNPTGTAITSIKPGRIDAKARGLSSAEADNSTLLNELAIESGLEGSELWIGGGVYPTGGFSLPDYATLRGTGTLRQRSASPSPQVISVSNAASPRQYITIEGITVDGNGTTNLITLSDNWPNGAHDLVVRNVRFINTHPSNYEQECGVQANTADGIVVEGCYFDCGAPMRFYNVDNLTLRNNWVENATIRNAADIQIYSTHVCRGLVVTGNRMRNLYRMGVELVVQGGGTGYFDAPLISDNVIIIADVFDGAAFGISSNYARRMRILNNTVAWYGTGTPPTYGIEPVSSPDTVVQGNMIQNFDIGIAINSSSRAVVDSNVFQDCYRPITLASPYSEVFDCTITRNNINNPRDYAIEIGTSSATGGGHVFEGNVIDRSASWTGDSTREFVAVRVGQMFYPIQIVRNRIIQNMAVPTLQNFFGVVTYIGTLGHLEDSTIERNIFLDRATTPMMVPIAANGGSATSADVVLNGNVRIIHNGTKNDVTAFP